MKEIVQDIEILKQISEPATIEEAPEIIKELEAALGAHENGIGLSAIQIGIPKRIIVVRNPDGGFDHFVNPECIEAEGEFTFLNEGCLSFPNLFLHTKRYHHYDLKRGYFDGDEYREQHVYFYYPETKDEYLSHERAITAIAIQHEMDHLDGKLITEYGVKDICSEKVGRNDPCPCGAMKDGKPVKYKKCCGKN